MVSYLYINVKLMCITCTSKMIYHSNKILRVFQSACCTFTDIITRFFNCKSKGFKMSEDVDIEILKKLYLMTCYHLCLCIQANLLRNTRNE